MKQLKWILVAALAAGVPVMTACDRGSDAEEAEASAPQAEEAPSEEAGSEEKGEASGATQKPDGVEAEEAAPTAVVGKPAPDFTLADETGKAHKLSDYRGKIVVLEWFNMDCPYVERHYQANTFEKTLQAIGADDVVWLAVDSTHNHTAATSKEWKAETSAARTIDYPILQDPSGEVGRLYEAKTTPHMYIVDAEGVLRYNGAIDDDPRGSKEEPVNYVISAVEALKAGKDIEPSTTKPYGCTVKYKS